MIVFSDIIRKGGIKLKKSERFQRIMNILSQTGNASTTYLSSLLGVSESTIRRDLNEMAETNEEVERVHGGVVLKSSKVGIELMFDLKLNKNIEEKKRIAKKALELIEDGDSIILDSGSTCFQIAKLLYQKKGLRVITCDVKIAEELGKFGDVETIIIGGLVRPGYYSIGGDLAVEIMSKFSAEKAFLGIDAIDIEKGITNASMFEVGIKKDIIKNAKQIIAVSDHTKFGKIALAKVADIEELDLIITDKDLNRSYIEEIETRGIKLILA